MRSKTRIKLIAQISGGLILSVAFVRFVGSELIGLLPWILAVACHEAGHLTAIFFRKKRIRGFFANALGLRIRLDGLSLSYTDELCISLAGPLASIIFALAFGNRADFFEISMMLGILNLLPAPFFDGYRAMYSAISLLTERDAAERIMRPVSIVFVTLMWLISVYLILRYDANISLFLISFALLVRYCFYQGGFYGI